MATAIVAGAGATAVIVVAVVAAIIATIVGSGPSAPSIAGAWNYSGSTFTFTSSGPDSYRVSIVTADAPQCARADDGTVTGTDGHYQGSINLYRQSGATGGSCEPQIGVAQITIAVAANNASANVSLVGNVSCPTCVPQTWTRQY